MNRVWRHGTELPDGPGQVPGASSARLLRSLLAPRPWQRSIGLRAGALVDPASGLVIDGFSDGPPPVDLELLGAVALELMRVSPLIVEATGTGPVPERPRRVFVESGRSSHLIVTGAFDARREPVLVTVVVDGGWKVADRAGRRLAAIPVLDLHHEQPALGAAVLPRRRGSPPAAGSDLETTVRVPRPRPYADPWWTRPPTTHASGARPTPYKRS